MELTQINLLMRHRPALANGRYKKAPAHKVHRGCEKQAGPNLQERIVPLRLSIGARKESTCCQAAPAPPSLRKWRF